MRFLDFLFEKDEAEDIEVEVVQKEVEQPVLKKPIIKQEEVVKPIAKVEPIVTNVTKSRHITVDEIEPKLIKPKEFVTVKQPYIFNPPISPIFGVMKGFENEKPRVLVNHKQKENTSRLGTVLSPYYGQGFVDETISSKDEVTKEEVIQEEILREPVVSDVNESLFNNDLTSELENVLEQEEYMEFDGLSIDDIIEKANEMIENESDKKVVITENISLFDGDIE